MAAAAQRKQDLADATLIRTQTLDDATLKHDRDMEKVRGKLTSFEQTLLNAGIERGSEEWNDAYAM